MTKTYIVTGENEDGWFFKTMNKEELEEYLAVRTGDGYAEGDPIDFEDLEKQDGSIRVDTWYYNVPHERFVVIDGDVKEIHPKELVTEVELQ